MKFELLGMAGIKPAIQVMRNPLKSYHKADSDFTQADGPDFEIGPADYDLAKRLCKGGDVHRKWMRMVYVWVNITAPLFWWSEADTYSHVPKSSESTMHTLYKEDFSDEDFADVLDSVFEPTDDPFTQANYEAVSRSLRYWQEKYKAADNVEEKNRIRHEMKKILPSGYLQKRGCAINYETLCKMYEQRKNHKLPEWSVDFVEFVNSLPYCEFIKGEGFRDE